MNFVAEEAIDGTGFAGKIEAGFHSDDGSMEHEYQQDHDMKRRQVGDGKITNPNSLIPNFLA
jgi:hypothetical protein